MSTRLPGSTTSTWSPCDNQSLPAFWMSATEAVSIVFRLSRKQPGLPV
jgi:hypothetical protein